MKIILDCGDYKPIISNVLSAQLEDVYNGIDIHTDQGHFGIAQRDSGLEIVLDGEIFLATDDPELLEALQTIKVRREAEYQQRMVADKTNNLPQSNGC